MATVTISPIFFVGYIIISTLLLLAYFYAGNENPRRKWLLLGIPLIGLFLIVWELLNPYAH